MKDILNSVCKAEAKKWIYSKYSREEQFDRYAGIEGTAQELADMLSFISAVKARCDLYKSQIESGMVTSVVDIDYSGVEL